MARSKLYGNRWRSLGSFAGGGQGDLFRVVDERGEFLGEHALKRLRNANRLDRFRAEVQAVKRLSHPNIVTIIAHSTFGARNLPQYLVMPIAEGGDLSKPGTVARYKENLEAVTPL